MADKKYIEDCGGIKVKPMLPKNTTKSTVKKTTTQSKNTSKGKK